MQNKEFYNFFSRFFNQCLQLKLYVIRLIDSRVNKHVVTPVVYRIGVYIPGACSPYPDMIVDNTQKNNSAASRGLFDQDQCVPVYMPVAAFNFKHSRTSYAMYITMNSARILRDSKIHCYSNITNGSSYQTQPVISTQSRKIIPQLDDLKLVQF